MPTLMKDRENHRKPAGGERAGDQIVAVPAPVRKLPEPVRKSIGDLSNTERVLVGLDLRPRT